MFSALVILAPLLHSYGINGFDFGMILFPLVIVLGLIINKLKVQYQFPKYYLLFFAYALVIPSILGVVRWGLTISNIIPFTIIGFSLSLGFSCNYFDKEYGLSLYKRIVYFVVLFFLLQNLMFLFFGIKISGLISFLPNIYGYKDLSSSDMVEYQMLGDRFSSIFLEPSYFAQYIIPFLIIQLFSIRGKFNIANAIFISVILLLIRSGIGIMLMSIIWGVWLFSNQNIGSIRKVLLTLSICLGIVFYISTDIGKNVVSRNRELTKTIKTKSLSSGYIRIFRGYNIYNELSWKNKIFGIGFKSSSLRDLINSSSYKWMFKTNDMNFNGIQSCLIGGGIICLFFLLLYLYALFQDTNFAGKMFLITLFLLLMSESVFCNTTMLFYIVLAYKFQPFSKNVL